MPWICGRTLETTYMETTYTMDKAEAEKVAKDHGATIEPIRSFGVWKIVDNEPQFLNPWFEDDPQLPCEGCNKGCELAYTEGPIYYKVSL